AGPPRGLARLLLSHLGRQRINVRIDVIGGKQARPQILIAVNPFLPEINVREHPAPPGSVEGRPVSHIRVEPMEGVEVSSVGRALRAVKIPDGTKKEFSLAR